MYSALLYTHLGLGDQVACHGFVRDYCARYEAVTIFASPHTYESVRFMYRDLKNLTVLNVDHIAATRYFDTHASQFSIALKIGYDKLDKTSGATVEQQFYQQADVDFEKKWSNFYVERDRTREEAFEKKITSESHYLFLHEDAERRFSIDRARIISRLPIIEAAAEATDNAFDYCTIIEKAREIHVIDSSFMFLIDCLPYQSEDQTIYVHRYARPNPAWHLPTLRKKWIIVGDSIDRHDSSITARLQRGLNKLFTK